MKKSLLVKVLEKYREIQCVSDDEPCPALGNATKVVPELRERATSLLATNGGPVSRALFEITPGGVIYGTLCDGVNIGYLYAKMEAEEAAKAAIN